MPSHQERVRRNYIDEKPNYYEWWNSNWYIKIDYNTGRWLVIKNNKVVLNEIL